MSDTVTNVEMRVRVRAAIRSANKARYPTGALERYYERLCDTDHPVPPLLLSEMENIVPRICLHQAWTK